jgi:hypothetical protein
LLFLCAARCRTSFALIICANPLSLHTRFQASFDNGG